MRTPHTDQTDEGQKSKPEDLVYFRFGKGAEEEHKRVRAIAQERDYPMVTVIRDLIKRGLRDYDTEQAIIAAYRGGDASAVNAGV